MSELEQRAVMQYAEKHFTIGKLNTIEFRYARQGFVELTAGPCPFLEGNDCTIHEVRPYTCRRFGCLRPDVKAEPLVMAPISHFVKYGTIGCSNLRERLLQSRIARRTYDLLQRKGMRWALSHGWSQHDADT
jgi:Fe-S-cluster containining protein